jgi:hypothetical protein
MDPLAGNFLFSLENGLIFSLEPGICDSCKFYLECGSVVPINLEILDIRL